jgi:hypothetical protein
LFIGKGMFDFSSANDAGYLQNMGPDFVSALKEDRRTLYSTDLLRSGFFILLAVGLYGYLLK